MCDTDVLLKYTEISLLKIHCITINTSSLENKAKQKLEVDHFDHPPHLWSRGGKKGKQMKNKTENQLNN